jgi:cytochrome aa3-600 menaquinol oxidase subunit 2
VELKGKLHKLFLLLPASFVLFLSGCSEKFAVLNPQGPVAKSQYNLIVWSFALMLVVIAVVFVLFAIVIIRYRERPNNMDYEPPEQEGNTLLEILWTAFPVLIVIALAIPTVKTTYALERAPKETAHVEPVTIYVTSANWKWIFSYPEEDIETVNYVNIPKGVPVKFKLTSLGPMNSFWVPELGGQKYTMNGMIMDLILQADHEGDYMGRSANFSGEHFTDMEFTVTAQSPEDYKKWVKEVKNTAPKLTEKKFLDLIEPNVVGRQTYSSNHLLWVDQQDIEYCDYNYFKNRLNKDK